MQDAGDDFTVTLQDQRVETYYVMFDLDKAGPIQDERVRCAMNLAIDRHEFSDALSDGFDPAGVRSVLARPAGLPRRTTAFPTTRTSTPPRR